MENKTGDPTRQKRKTEKQKNQFPKIHGGERMAS
jgi:hypothetical protein